MYISKVISDIKKQINNCYGSHKEKNTKQPLHFLRPMCKTVYKYSINS